MCYYSKQLEVSRPCEPLHHQTKEQGTKNDQDQEKSYPLRAARARHSLPSRFLFGAADEGDGSVDGAVGAAASPNASWSSTLKGRDRFTWKGLESSLSPDSTCTVLAPTARAASSATEAPGSSRISAS